MVFIPFELRWQDIVDILLNSYIIFRLYVLFRGTNAFRVFLGILGLLLLQRSAVAAGLILTSWALQGITAVAALIVVVVFRNEIRTALQARNLKTFFWGTPRPLHLSSHASIVEVVFALAEKQIGALIVLPGVDDVSQKVHSSIRTDCRLSREMLMSIFWPDNPVHDGAVIVRGDRIVEVAAVLPLSKRTDIPSYYGTRHRAAAGIAEVSDAIVLVVSEQRGTVSAVHGETFRSFSSAGALAEYLERYQPVAPAVHTGRRQALTMAVAGVVSLLFITSVWFSFARRDGTLVSMEIPLEYVRRDTPFNYVDADTDTVRVQLGGAAALLKNISASQVKVRVELRNAEIGANTLRIDPANFTLPPGVALRKVTPDTVTVNLDRHAVRTVPAQVDWVGVMPPDLHIERCEVTPERVQVSGPSLKIADVTTIYTEPVDVAALPGRTLKDVRLVVPGHATAVAPEKVTLRWFAPQINE